jgi:hypothetical protein
VAPTFPKALDAHVLPGDAVFLLRHMPDAHLQFRLTCPHGVFLRRAGAARLPGVNTVTKCQCEGGTEHDQRESGQ